MASFEAKKFNFSDINGGQRFENGQIPEQIAFNAPIEASAYAQDLADQALAKADQALNYAVGGNLPELPPLLAYPIGTVYIQTTNSEPAELFGGTWAKLDEGRTLISTKSGVYAIGETGGSADAVVIKHQHNITLVAKTQPGTFSTRPSMTQTSTEATTTASTNEVGEYGKGKNMQPYMVVNMWVRVK